MNHGTFDLNLCPKGQTFVSTTGLELNCGSTLRNFSFTRKNHIFLNVDFQIQVILR